MIKTSIKNFTKKELACKCCGAFYVDDEALVCLQAFRHFLNRKYKKNVRITVNCGSRCPDHNSDPKVGGAKRSRHLTGKAFDLKSPDIRLDEFFISAIESKLFTTILRYKTFIHCDTHHRKGYRIYIEDKRRKK